jgi:hypothetical protein
MKIEIRPMSMKEHDEYQDFMDELNKKMTKNEITASKVIREAEKWVLQKIYNVDVYAKECKLTPGTIFAITERTRKATDEANEADIKNFVMSGSGEAKAK